MSYDVYTIIELDGEKILCQEAGNMTWNVNSMYYACLKDMDVELESMSDWNNKPSNEILPHIEGIIRIMESDPNRFKAMNPENGWGNYEGALKWMKEIRIAILLSPDAAIFCIE